MRLLAIRRAERQRDPLQDLAVEKSPMITGKIRVFDGASGRQGRRLSKLLSC